MMNVTPDRILDSRLICVLHNVPVRILSLDSLHTLPLLRCHSPYKSLPMLPGPFPLDELQDLCGRQLPSICASSIRASPKVSGAICLPMLSEKIALLPAHSKLKRHLLLR